MNLVVIELKISFEATVCYISFTIGLYSIDQIKAWADTIIDRLEAPDIPEIIYDLSIAKKETDILRLLRELNAANQTGNAAGNVVPGKVLGQAELGRVSTASELATPPSGVTSTQSGQDLPRAVGVANSEAMKQAIRPCLRQKAWQSQVF